MEEADEKVTKPVRRTRSAAKVATPSPKASRPKPLSRKTRKKVVMMEVEVSDDEDEDTVENEKKNDVSNDDEESGDKKSEVTEEKPTKLEEEIVELNGGSNDNESKELDDPVVMNDVNMFQEEPDSKTESNEAPKEIVEKMEVDNEELSENKRNKPKPEEEPKEKKTVEHKQEVCDDSEEPEKKKPKIETSEVKIIEKNVEEVKEKKVEEVKEKKVEEVKEKKVDEVKEKKVDEVKEKKVDEVKEKKVEKVKEKKVEEVIEKKVEEVIKEKVAEVKEKKVEDIKEGKVEQVIEEKVEEVKGKKVKDIKEGKEEVEEEKVEEVKKEETVDKVKDDKPKEIAKPDTVDETEDKPKEKIKIEDENKPEEKIKTDDKPQEKMKTEEKDEDSKSDTKDESGKQTADPDAENISEDELPAVQAVKVPEAEEVSDEELPGPKRAELPADTEVVSEDELPTVKSETKKETGKRKLNETDYDPGSPTSECEVPAKKVATDTPTEKEKEEPKKPKKLPELDKYWKAVNDDPTDFTGWTYLLQYVDQENDMEAAREAYDAFLSHYPYCYGYWRKYADYEKRKGNKKKCEEVFDRGLKAISLSVDLWIHYLTYVKATRAEDEEFIRSQFERALTACGLEFRSDRLWDSFIKWETEGKRLQRVTAIYDRLLSTPTQGYTSHFDNFQEHVASNPPNKVIELDEFLALRKEVRQALKHDAADAPPADSDAPPGDDDQTKVVSSDEESKAIKERIVSIRRKVHKATVNAVTSRWNYEEGIKRPYFHVKPLERCQLKNWHDYLDYETEQGDRSRIIVLFERCLIACALYEEFWLKFVHYLEGLKDPEMHSKIRDVYERACTIHHLKKPNLHLQWAMFEETVENSSRAAEILVNLEKSVPNVLQIAYRRVNLERRRGDHEKCTQLYEHYITNSKNKMISSSISIKYSRFCFVVLKDIDKAQEILKSAIAKDPNNPRLYLQLIDLTLQKGGVTEKEIIDVIDLFLEKDSTDPEQKVLFAQRKLEYLEDFGGDVQSVQSAHEQYQKLLKLNKDIKKKEPKVGEPVAPATKSKEKPPTPSSTQSGTYGNYGQYGNSGQPNYPYSGNQQGPNYYPPQYGQGDQQYQYQNWQYPQGGYGGYNQWGGYSGGYGY